MLRQQRARFAYYLILPSLILITLLNVVPLIQGVIVSLQRQNMIRPNPTAFVGFRHYYRALFEEDILWASLGRTVVWTAGSVIGAYIVALALALLLNREIRGRALFRALLLIPWVIPDVATALLWKWLYADEYGVINHLLRTFGLIARPVQWLANPDMAMASVIAVQIWKLTPVMFIVLLAALQNVPKELHEAADARRRRPRPAVPLRHVSGHPADQHHHHPAGVDLDLPGLRHRLPADRRRARRCDGNPADADLPEGFLGLRHRLRRGDRDAHARLPGHPQRRLSLRLPLAERKQRRGAAMAETASAIELPMPLQRLDYRKAFALLIDLRAAACRGHGHPLPGLLDGFIVAEARPGAVRPRPDDAADQLDAAELPQCLAEHRLSRPISGTASRSRRSPRSSA